MIRTIMSEARSTGQLTTVDPRFLWTSKLRREFENEFDVEFESVEIAEMNNFETIVKMIKSKD